MSKPVIERIENFGLSKKERPKTEFAEVGIVGCGTNGQSLAIMIASKGIEVTFIELSQELIDEAYQEIEEELDKKILHWGITEGEKRAVLARIKGSLDFNDLKNCDMVIEAILSKSREKSRDIRKDVFRKIEEHVSPHAIIATNSTTVAITEISAALKHRDRCISMHISITSPSADLVEVVKSLYTSKETCQNVRKFAILIDKHFVEVAESPGLITVRMFAPMINEACDILLERVAKMTEIDLAVRKSLNLPLGPFEMADKIGIGKVIRWLDNLYDEFGDRQYKASPILKRLERANHLGRKTNEGFYKYNDLGQKLEPAIKY